MDNLTIFAIVAVALVVFYFLISYRSAENMEHREDPKSKELQQLVDKLKKKIEEMEFKDKQTEQKIKDLQRSEAIEREQTKYLTANVNKTLYTI